MSRANSSASPADPLRDRALRLGLHGLVSRWDAFRDAPWVEPLIKGEEDARQRRGLERRIRTARIGRFKLMADFDWKWPTSIDREKVESLLTLGFLKKEKEEDPGNNVALIAPNGLGKTMLAQNLTYQAVLQGYSARFVTASALLAELLQIESPSALERRLRRFARPALLAIDEVGYLSYSARHADLLFQVVSRRENRSTLVTTNRPFSEWNQVFPNATSVVALVDRLIHRIEVVEIEGESYRLKESRERQARLAAERSAARVRKRDSKKAKG
jgi:DNA replication protein DnaC